MPHDCITAADFKAFDYSIASALYILTLAIILGPAIIIHELGHALAGWAIGGHMRPTGFNFGYLWCRYGRRLRGGVWETYRHWFPNIDFESFTQGAAWHQRVVAAAGVLANAIAALIGYLIIRHYGANLHWSDFNSALLNITSVNRGCMTDLSTSGKDLLRPPMFNFVIYGIKIFFWVNILAFLNLLPFPKGIDGYYFWRSQTGRKN